uniref:DDE Tnp4 domain-containing protein n=2 Tax=Rhabditophanes sp. KR3021 TaxID=114890 RepID=A0AC35U849_9BILA
MNAMMRFDEIFDEEFPFNETFRRGPACVKLRKLVSMVDENFFGGKLIVGYAHNHHHVISLCIIVPTIVSRRHYMRNRTHYAVRDHETGQSKGFCYEDQRSTVLVVDNMNGITVTFEKID